VVPLAWMGLHTKESNNDDKAIRATNDAEQQFLVL
jgi:hypothetical protein